MFEEKQPVKLFMVTTKEVIRRLESLKDIEVSKLQDAIEESFDDFNVEGEEDLNGIDTWCDFTADGKYELAIGIDHEVAYEFTVYIETKDNKVSVYNVL